MPKVDDLIEALVVKAGDVSPRWTQAFPPTPAGYRKLQRLLTRYGYENLRSTLEWIVANKIVPDNPMGVLSSLLAAGMKEKDVTVQGELL